MQASITAVIARNIIKAGLYSYVQHENDFSGATFADGSLSIAECNIVTGGVAQFYAQDGWKPSRWITIFAGLRESYFSAAISEDYLFPPRRHSH